MTSESNSQILTSRSRSRFWKNTLLASRSRFRFGKICLSASRSRFQKTENLISDTNTLRTLSYSCFLVLTNADVESDRRASHFYDQITTMRHLHQFFCYYILFDFSSNTRFWKVYFCYDTKKKIFSKFYYWTYFTKYIYSPISSEQNCILSKLEVKMFKTGIDFE